MFHQPTKTHTVHTVAGIRILFSLLLFSNFSFLVHGIVRVSEEDPVTPIVGFFVNFSLIFQRQTQPNGMDRKEDKKADFDEKINNSPSLRSCSDCRTTRTPLWRGGPDGPKSLCNACGIKYNKKRRQLLGLETAKSNRKKTRKRDRSEEIREILKMRFMAFGSDMLLQRSRKLMGKLREEERAALLLMALSCA